RKMIVVPNDERVERVFRIERRLAMCVDALAGINLAFCFRLARLIRRSKCVRQAADLELYVKRMAGDLKQLFLNQIKVVFFEPNLAKVIGYFKRQAIALEGLRPNLSEPKIVD